MARDNSVLISRIETAPYGTNAYVVTCTRTRNSVLVDAPTQSRELIEGLEGTIPRYLLITHNHMDHTGALSKLKSRLDIPVAAHGADADKLPLQPDILLCDGDTVPFGDIELKVLHTPGHTPGSICLLTGRYLISGDTIFPGGPGKTGSPEALRQIIESITSKIFVLPDDTQIYPGHGDSTMLAKEKKEFAVFDSQPHAPGLCGDVLWLSS
jgi:glyoxylase-like metal-dependent hydrolase (beta-lactamase superfamily II)